MPFISYSCSAISLYVVPHYSSRSGQFRAEREPSICNHHTQMSSLVDTSILYGIHVFLYSEECSSCFQSIATLMPNQLPVRDEANGTAVECPRYKFCFLSIFSSLMASNYWMRVFWDC